MKILPEEKPYRKVFIKRNQHPEVLYEVFKAEKNKPENADKEVVFDKRMCVVKVNNEEVDRFTLFMSFQ